MKFDYDVYKGGKFVMDCPLEWQRLVFLENFIAGYRKTASDRTFDELMALWERQVTFRYVRFTPLHRYSSEISSLEFPESYIEEGATILNFEDFEWDESASDSCLDQTQIDMDSFLSNL